MPAKKQQRQTNGTVIQDTPKTLTKFIYFKYLYKHCYF